MVVFILLIFVICLWCMGVVWRVVIVVGMGVWINLCNWLIVVRLFIVLSLLVIVVRMVCGNLYGLVVEIIIMGCWFLVVVWYCLVIVEVMVVCGLIV